MWFLKVHKWKSFNLTNSNNIISIIIYLLFSRLEIYEYITKLIK